MTTNKNQESGRRWGVNEYMVRIRQHNNANVLALGARVAGPALACSIVDALAEDFEVSRHQVRVDEMTRLENQNLNVDPEAQHD